MSKNIVLLKHGGKSKRKALEILRNLGTVYVVDDDTELADQSVHLIPVPSLTVDQIINALRTRKIHVDSVVTFLDPAFEIASKVAFLLKVPCLDPKVVRNLKDKLAMRQKLKEERIENVRFANLPSADMSSLLEQVRSLNFDFPYVIKPRKGAFSLGVFKINNENSLQQLQTTDLNELTSSTFSKYMSGTEESGWMIEEFLDGLEVNVVVLGHPTSPQILAIHEKVVTEHDGTFREDVFVTAPNRLSTQQEEEVRKHALQVTKALGFSRGVGDLDMRVTKSGIYSIEFQAVPAGALVSDMVEIRTGLNPYRLHSDAYLYFDVPSLPSFKSKQSAAMEVLHAEKRGSFRFLMGDAVGKSEGLVRLEVLNQTGTVINPSSEYLGFILCQGNNPAEALANMQRVKSQIELVQP